jgi:hypothetical protein
VAGDLRAAQPDQPANICSTLPEYGFTITEHDPDRPRVVLVSEHRTIRAPDGLDFFAWAHEQWPAPRWSVELDPWQLSPAGGDDLSLLLDLIAPRTQRAFADL